MSSKKWYACQTHGTASSINRADCEQWCDANNNDIEADVFCDRCRSNICCVILLERNLSWIGYGESYHAYKNIDKATARNKQSCENWCNENNDNMKISQNKLKQYHQLC